MPIIVVCLGFLMATQGMAQKMVRENCKDIQGFSSTWSQMVSAFPSVQSELVYLGKASGDVTTVYSESGAVLSYEVNLTRCYVDHPQNESGPLDGIRTFIAYKDWIQNSKRVSGGMMVEYYKSTDPTTGVVRRNFVSLILCRSLSSCQRRGIIQKQPETETNPEPFEPQPITLEPSPAKPKK